MRGTIAWHERYDVLGCSARFTDPPDIRFRHGSGSMSMRRFTAADLDAGHVPVTQGLAPAPSLFLLHAVRLCHVRDRECRDMGPTLESRVLGPLSRHGVLVWAGLPAGVLCYVMLC